MHEKYSKDGLRILAVNAWNEPPAKVRDFVQKQKLPYTILMGGNDTLRGPYAGKSIPDNFLIDAEGRIVAHKLDFSEADMRALEREIQKLLN